MELVFKTEKYEGPLDLLLTLISKNKMSIFDIRISELFEQYMAYVGEMQRLDMEIAGEFITMAAELMYIKSKMLLPKPEEEDPRQELVRKLMEYKTAKEAAKLLSERESEFAGRFEKDTDEIKPSFDENIRLDSNLLSAALAKIFIRDAERREAETLAPMEAIAPMVHRKVVSVGGRIIFILRKMYRRGSVHFEEIFDGAEGRSEIITIFYALLELLRTGRVTMRRAEGDVDGTNIVLGMSYTHARDEKGGGDGNE